MKSYETNDGKQLDLTQHQPQHIEMLALDILVADPEGITFSVLAPDAPSLATIRLNLDWADLTTAMERNAAEQSDAS